jgi:hypothetical protein
MLRISASKLVITAIGIMKMVEAGRLNLEEKVSFDGILSESTDKERLEAPE